MQDSSRHLFQASWPKGDQSDFVMIVLSTVSQNAASGHRVTSCRSSASPGNQDGDARPRPDSFSQGAARFSSMSTLDQPKTPRELPELGHALRNLYAGCIRRDISTSQMGEKLMRNSNLMAQRVLHFTSNQQTER